MNCISIFLKLHLYYQNWPTIIMLAKGLCEATVASWQIRHLQCIWLFNLKLYLYDYKNCIFMVLKIVFVWLRFPHNHHVSKRPLWRPLRHVGKSDVYCFYCFAHHQIFTCLHCFNNCICISFTFVFVYLSQLYLYDFYCFARHQIFTWLHCFKGETIVFV